MKVISHNRSPNEFFPIDHPLDLETLETRAQNPDGPLIHGTPVDPVQMGSHILPFQAMTGTLKPGEVVEHGHKAVSVSKTLRFPTIRSLLHPQHPDFLDVELYPLLSRITNAAQQAHIFTSSRAIQRIREQKSQGYIYISEAAPPSTICFNDREDIAEWRVPEPLYWDWATSTSAEDLPADLLVIKENDRDAREFIARFAESEKSPLATAQSMGVAVMKLADYVSL